MEDRYREQHKHRMMWMPWLYAQLKPQQRAWAMPWQQEVQDALRAVEQVHIGRDCFIAPTAHIFAEPHRDIWIGDGCAVGAEVFLHGPIRLGDTVSINPRCHLDGGAGGIVIGTGCRIATGVRMFAWNHGVEAHRPIREQPVHSRGIRIGDDVWLGAGAGVVDGVTIGHGAVVGMGAVVTRDVPAGAKVAGVPARHIGWRG